MSTRFNPDSKKLSTWDAVAGRFRPSKASYDDKITPDQQPFFPIEELIQQFHQVIAFEVGRRPNLKLSSQLSMGHVRWAVERTDKPSGYQYREDFEDIGLCGPYNETPGGIEGVRVHVNSKLTPLAERE